MFEPKEEITAAVDLLKERFGHLSKGDFIPWSEIDALVGHHGRYPGTLIVDKFRTWLRKDKGILAVAVRGSGLRLCTDNYAATDYMADRSRKGYRCTNRTIHHLRAVDGTKLSDHGRQVFSQQQYALKYQRLVQGRACREFEKDVKKTDVPPVRKTA